ncbi:hypothetical protein JTB14_021283 [Gonioctena quinquepunctata]|nr:hypothetical protein JTB14_021283 [Gonioctena quinquepunctata]
MSGSRQRPKTPERDRIPQININSEAEFPTLSPESPESASNTSIIAEIPTFSGVVTRARANSTSSIQSNISVKSQPPMHIKFNEKSSENPAKTQNPPILTKIFNIRNLPDNLKLQSEVYGLLSRSDVLGGNLENIKVNYNRTALVETIDPINIETIRRKIRHVGGCPKIEIRDLRNQKERPQRPNKEPTMSFVIKDVDKNLSDEAIADHFRDTEVDFVRRDGQSEPDFPLGPRSTRTASQADEKIPTFASETPNHSHRTTRRTHRISRNSPLILR